MTARSTAFAALIVAGVVSSVGTGLTTFALAVEAYRLTGDASAVSLMAGAGMLPMILMAPIGGVLADRLDRRTLMLLGDGGSALALLLVARLLAAADPDLLGVALALALSSVFAGLTEPALRATISDLVPPGQLDRASGLVQMTGAARWLLAPALAGALLAIMPAWQIILLDAASFGCTLLATLFIRATLGAAAPRRGGARPLAELADGARILRRAGLGQLLAVMTVATFAAGAIQSLLAPIALPIGSEQQLGWITSIGATGMMAGSIAVGVLGVRMDLRRGLALGLGLAGLGLVVVGARPDLLVIGCGALLFFLALPLANASAEVLLRRNVPNEALGRAWGITSILTQLGSVLAVATLGPLADAWLAPALAEGGALAVPIGSLIGTGTGRGAALAVILAGAALALTAVWAARSRALAPAATVAARNPDRDAAADDPAAPSPPAADASTIPPAAREGSLR